jgi:tRNA G18 (ribose-2'-O)-methylase SpoU
LLEFASTADVAKILSLDDPTDPRLACYADLRWDSNPGPESSWFIVEGRLCVQRLIESPLEVISVLVEAGKEQEVASWLGDSTPIYVLPAGCVRQLVGYDFHRGVLACGRRPMLLSSDSLSFSHSPTPLALAAIGVNQRENLGSMLRTAAALGIDQILVGGETADPFSRRTVRVSMAAVLKQTLYRLVSPARELQQLQATYGMRTFVTTLSPDATPLDQVVMDERPGILVMGNEANGIDQAIEAIASDRVTIPMRLGTDSMNVSVATAIFMYELTTGLRTRQRSDSPRELRSLP